MLELKNISFSAQEEKGTKEILNDVSLTINGGFTVLTGPNGGGKSTLAKIIAGIYTPASGKILLDGKDITNLGIDGRAKAGISYGFQQPVRFKGITVKDLIEIAAGRTITVAAACEYLSEVGLCAKDYVNREVNASLSGGEIKRIEIATILARGTSFSIFDEPEAGIDLWSFNSLIKVFENMNKKIKGSILIISHQERILSIADRIIVLNNGKVEKDGKPDEVMPFLTVPPVCSKLKDTI